MQHSETDSLKGSLEVILKLPTEAAALITLYVNHAISEKEFRWVLGNKKKLTGIEDEDD